jgi:hypothetical protein
MRDPSEYARCIRVYPGACRGMSVGARSGSRKEAVMKAAVIVSIALAALVVSQQASARTVDKNYHETFDVSEGMKLVLYHGDGDVTVTPWDKDVVDVRVRYHGEITSVGIGKEADFTVDFKQTDDAVIVRGNEGGASGIFFFRSTSEYEYFYTISAPSYLVLELSGDDGDVELSGWRADINCELDDGDITMADVSNATIEIDHEDGDVSLADISGDIALRGDDGDVTVANGEFGHALFSLEDGAVSVADASGNFELSIDDGDIDFRRVVVGNVDIRGNDGDVDLDVEVDPETTVSVSTDDGDVTMRFSGELSFDYLVTMDDGDVDIYLDDATNTKTSEHRVSGVVGGGEGHVRVRTSDGDVTIVSGD